MRLVILVVAAASLTLAASQPSWAEDEPQTGLFDTTFTKRSPHSQIKSLYRRYRERAKRDQRDYDIKDQKYQMYVPTDYDPQQSYGLMVWLESSRSGEGMNPAFQKILDAHRVIWIRPRGGGGSGGAGMWFQMGLAIDAAYNVGRLYSIDKDRVYIAGVGSASKPAARLGFGAAEFFSGGAYLMGPIEFYDDVTVEVSGNTLYYWPADYGSPPRSSLRIAKKQCRFVFHVGADNSKTRDLIQHALKPRNFQHLFEITTSYASHAPDAATFEKAIQLLDSPFTPNAP